MNDFHMSTLAASLVDGLRAEADRHRMARTGKPQREPLQAEESHRPRRFKLGSLLRRAAV